MEATATPTRIPLGPFELHAPIGGGAMGEVWRGVHATQQVPVAVKLITREQARHDEVLELFHNEVRAVARLHHPGIVMVLDYGQASAEAMRLSAGRIAEGSPYLAMEFASGGTLPRPRAPMPWNRLRALVLELLDALSHAHARGVVHRDIKPGNILIATMQDGRAGLKLSDFGIARALGVAEGREGVVAGTPHYMSPEQILDLRRDQGPWTDLYALGCLAFALATGQRLFWPARGVDLLRAHVHVPPPRVARPDLPPDFHLWLERMLAKSPAERYQLAADAAWGLLQLGRGTDLGAAPARDDRTVVSEVLDELASGVVPGIEVASLGASAATSAIGDALLDEEAGGGETLRISTDAMMDAVSTANAVAATAEPAPAAAMTELATLAEIVHTEWDLASTELGVVPRRGALPYPLPPCPDSWRRRAVSPATMRLRGAGLGLFGLRTVPLVDRDESRDRIWDALREVCDGGRARLLLLEGGAGVGKSRVVEWMSQRAHEVGAALALHATHAAHGGRADGLGPMLAAHLGCLGLERDAALDRARAFVQAHRLEATRHAEEDDALSLVELMMPAAASRGPRVRFVSPAERHDAVKRFVDRLGRWRPCVLWLDDLQWGADTLGFLLHLMAAQAAAPTPVLVLGTVRDDLLASRPVEAAQVAELLALDRTAALRLGPLGERDHRHLVEHLLGLEGELVEQVAGRTGGNPLFAIQLVGDWVQRRVLEPGARGFRLRPGERAVIPDDIHELWTARLDQLFTEPAARQASWLALELAATLGKDFDPFEWHEVCARAGVRIPPQLVERLLAHRLLESTPTGLAFTHAMLCESLERSAREARRLRGHHLLCARMLGEGTAATTAHVAERRGAHLLLAGELGEALEPLLQGAVARQQTGDFRQAHDLFARRDEAMRALGVPAFDARWGHGWVRQSRAYFMQGLAEPALELARRAADAARAHGWLDVAALAATEQANAAFAIGQVAEAVALHEEALERYAQLPESADEADSLRHFAKVLLTRHEVSRGEAALRKALDIFERLGDGIGAAPAMRHLAAVEMTHGRIRQAVELLEDALERFQRHGFRRSVASCLNDLGELWRQSGRLDEAERHYRESARLYDAVGSHIASVPRYNLALVLLVRGRFDDARQILRALLALADAAQGRMLEEPWFQLAMLPCCAVAQEWSHFETYLRRASERIANMGVVDPDLALVARLGAEHALAQRMTHCARAAFEFALGQYRRLEDDARISELERELRELE